MPLSKFSNDFYILGSYRSFDLKIKNFFKTSIDHHDGKKKDRKYPNDKELQTQRLYVLVKTVKLFAYLRLQHCCLQP
jgi:hypothetical protein